MTDATDDESRVAPPNRPGRGTRLRRLLVDVVIVAAVFFGIRTWQARSVIDVGSNVPDLVATTLDGQPFDLTELRGEVVQLRFQATWCGACRREQNSVNRLVDGLNPDEHVITIFDPDEVDVIRAYVDEYDIPGTIVIGSDRLARAWGVTAFPTNIWIRPDGTVDSRSVGLTTRPVMRLHLDRARP